MICFSFDNNIFLKDLSIPESKSYICFINLSDTADIRYDSRGTRYSRQKDLHRIWLYEEISKYKDRPTHFIDGNIDKETGKLSISSCTLQTILPSTNFSLVYAQVNFNVNRFLDLLEDINQSGNLLDDLKLYKTKIGCNSWFSMPYPKSDRYSTDRYFLLGDIGLLSNNNSIMLQEGLVWAIYLLCSSYFLDYYTQLIEIIISLLNMEIINPEDKNPNSVLIYNNLRATIFRNFEIDIPKFLDSVRVFYLAVCKILDGLDERYHDFKSRFLPLAVALGSLKQLMPINIRNGISLNFAKGESEENIFKKKIRINY